MYMLTMMTALRDEEVARFMNVLTGKAAREEDDHVPTLQESGKPWPCDVYPGVEIQKLALAETSRSNLAVSF